MEAKTCKRKNKLPVSSHLTQIYELRFKSYDLRMMNKFLIFVS